MNVQQAAADALKLLREHGWCQWQYEHLGKICIAQALLRAAQLQGERSSLPVYNEVKAVVEAQYGDLAASPLSYWNDKPERTFAEVEAVLEKVAAKEVTADG